jgi:SAM-dependent methyltransferase
MGSDGFIDVPFTRSNLDRYLVRTSVREALRIAMPRFRGQLLDIGCGTMPYRRILLDECGIDGYTGLDLFTTRPSASVVTPDARWDGRQMPFDNARFQCAIATEVLEHCFDPAVLLQEAHRVLSPGGIFFFTVPFLWNLHEVPQDAYRYTPFSLERLLMDSGFRSVDIHAMGGWHASMAQMLGLWTRRAPMSAVSRNILSLLVKPVMSVLIRRDRRTPLQFREGQMITGLYGWAEK